MARDNHFLEKLIVPRNDPALAAEILATAMQGQIDAQYGMGLIYAEGRGVEQDTVEAYAWLSVAMLQGDMDAEILRDAVMQSMPIDDINRAIYRADAGQRNLYATGRWRNRCIESRLRPSEKYLARCAGTRLFFARAAHR